MIYDDGKYVSDLSVICLIAVSLVDSDTTDASESQSLQHVSCVSVDVDSFLFQCRNFWDEVQSTFTLLLLELQRDTTDRGLCDTAHQVCRVSGNLVSHPLRWQDSDLIDDTLVGMEVQRQPCVVLLDDSTGTLLYCLCSDTLLPI